MKFNFFAKKHEFSAGQPFSTVLALTFLPYCGGLFLMGKIFKVLAAVFVAAFVVCGQFAGGDGTESDPWIIETAEQLNLVRENLSAHYRLGNDIHLNGSAENQWVAIGTSANRFNGVFDGAGFVVSGVHIDNNLNNQGFFGFIGAGAMIKNLGLAQTHISGRENVGGLVGTSGGGDNHE
jgi:hypothetical protein